MTEERKEYWIRWAKAALIRALRTFGQTLAASLGVGITLYEMPWVYALGTAAGAAVLSLCTSLSGLPEVDGESSIDPGSTTVLPLFDDSDVMRNA